MHRQTSPSRFPKRDSLFPGFQGAVVEVDLHDEGDEIWDYATSLAQQRRTVPRIWIKGVHIGGHDDLMTALSNGTLEKLK